jgi:hypothetical protein
MTAFEDQHGSPGPRQIRGRGQPVMAAADDDDVVAHVEIVARFVDTLRVVG